jgi:hypothetical protein
MSKLIDLTGQTFNRLTVICRATNVNKKSTNAHWECKCMCGKTTIVRGADLRSGGSKSCGCLGTESIILRNLIHGKTRLPEYAIWKGMKNRCTNPKNKSFKHYGGCGIKVHPAWLESFPEFYEHVGPRPTPKHSIERINNNLGYVPGNVKWATGIEQGNNKGNNRSVVFGERTMTLAQWARITGINDQTLFSRIDTLGWPIEKAFNQPVKGH